MSWVAVGVAGASAITSGVIAAKQNKAAKKIKVGTEEVSEEQKKECLMPLQPSFPALDPSPIEFSSVKL